jgi:RNA-directed DNA polymerase
MIDCILDRDNLHAAWLAVEANKGAPGIDQVTLARWGRNWEANLERVRAQVLANTYRPRRPRRFRVLKKDGTYRELSILTVSDRVLQRAALNILEPIFEQRFLNCSFGYRPNRSVANAVTTVVRCRERGLPWALRGDVQDCFDSLDHDVIMEHVRQAVQDTVVLGLIAAWLKAGRRTWAKSRHGPQVPEIRDPQSEIRHPVGIPLGAVISPLLCNVVLHQMDVDLTCAGWTLVRYADDLAALTRSEAEANAAREATEAALAKLRLRLNPHKTQITSFEAGFVFLGVEFRGDQYSYVRQNKRIVVQGPTTRILYRQPPEFY